MAELKIEKKDVGRRVELCFDDANDEWGLLVEVDKPEFRVFLPSVKKVLSIDADQILALGEYL